MTATTVLIENTKIMEFDTLVDYIKEDFYSTPQVSPSSFNCKSIALAEKYADTVNTFVPVKEHLFGTIEGYWSDDFVHAEHQAFKEIEAEWDDEDYWGLPFAEAVELFG